jgi:hypothetical protein
LANLSTSKCGSIEGKIMTIQEQETRKAMFREMGFRFTNPASVVFLDGTMATVAPYGYQDHKDTGGLTSQEKRELKVYEITQVTDVGERIERVSEFVLERKLGTEAFGRLT